LPYNSSKSLKAFNTDWDSGIVWCHLKWQYQLGAEMWCAETRKCDYVCLNQLIEWWFWTEDLSKSGKHWKACVLAQIRIFTF
jgi:hypothetical protein